MGVAGCHAIIRLSDCPCRQFASYKYRIPCWCVAPSRYYGVACAFFHGPSLPVNRDYGFSHASWSIGSIW